MTPASTGAKPQSLSSLQTEALRSAKAGTLEVPRRNEQGYTIREKPYPVKRGMVVRAHRNSVHALVQRGLAEYGVSSDTAILTPAGEAVLRGASE